LFYSFLAARIKKSCGSNRKRKETTWWKIDWITY